MVLNHSKSALDSVTSSNSSSPQKISPKKLACSNSNQPRVITDPHKTFGETDSPPATSMSSMLPMKQITRSSKKHLNSNYKYKSLADIKSSALAGSVERVNLFAVVHQITKELTETTTGKFTTICKITDESLKSSNFDLHFFVPDDILIKEIRVGDILRLHRVKMELFNNDVDGRIFSNNDIVIFKEKSIDSPLHIIKNLQITEGENKRAQDLTKWYQESCLHPQKDKITQLADIVGEGEYQIVCKIVSDPVVEKTKVILSVTDGSVLSKLCSSNPYNTVTNIHVFKRITAYAVLKSGTTVLLREVEAVQYSKLQLVINTCSRYDILDESNEQVINIERRISEWKEKPETSENTVTNSKADQQLKKNTITDNNISKKSAVVKLVKLSNEEVQNIKIDGQLNNEVASVQSVRSKKRTLILEDASSLSNTSVSHNITTNTKQARLDSLSTSHRNDDPVVFLDRIDLEVSKQNGGEKVNNWLFHPDNKLGSNKKLVSEVDELETETNKLFLLGMDQNSPDMSKYLNSMKKRLRLFLVEVIPDPVVDNLDLVSGYCSSGCRQVFLFSKIHWQTVNNQEIPYCPDCIITQQEKWLELMFMMELHVFDANGEHGSILVCREHAENFMRCSVEEYVKDEQLRMSRVCLLTDYNVKNTFGDKVTPMLDVTVTVMGKILFLIDTSLKFNP